MLKRVSASVCISGSKRTQRPRPSDFARYIAASASRRRSSGETVEVLASAMPMLPRAMSLRPSICIGSRRTSRRRVAVIIGMSASPTSSRMARSIRTTSTISAGPWWATGRRWVPAAWTASRQTARVGWPRSRTLAPTSRTTKWAAWSARKSTAGNLPERSLRARAVVSRSVNIERLARPVNESWKAIRPSCASSSFRSVISTKNPCDRTVSATAEDSISRASSRTHTTLPSARTIRYSCSSGSPSR